MKNILKRMTMTLLAFALVFAYLPFMGSTYASTFYSFSTPTDGATVKAGSKVAVKFWAGVESKKTEYDDWGRPATTTYYEMPVTFKVFKGDTEIYSKEFKYKEATYIETKYTPTTTGTLKLCIYGRNEGLNSVSQVLQATTTINVKPAKASQIKSIKPEIMVERTAKKKARITCSNAFGYGIKIYRATSKNGKYKLIKKTSKSTYTDSSLSASKVYYYKVKIYAKSGKKVYESKWSAKALAGKYTEGIQLTNTSKGVKVKWKPVSGTGFYLIRRSTEGIPSDDVQALCYGADETEFIDTELEKGKTYYYTVEACRDDSSVIKKYSGKQYKITVK